MSTCERCGATFHCAIKDVAPAAAPCWCTYLPPAVAVPGPGATVGCWCPACLARHIDAQRATTG